MYRHRTVSTFTEAAFAENCDIKIAPKFHTKVKDRLIRGTGENSEGRCDIPTALSERSPSWIRIVSFLMNVVTDDEKQAAFSGGPDCHATDR